MYRVMLYHYRDGFETDFPTEASRTLYDASNPSDTVTLLTGTGKNSITELPTFDFTILPNHPLYNEIVKFKTWVTVYRGPDQSDFDIALNRYSTAISSSVGLHDACGKLMQMLFKSGNVDLLNRPQVSAEDLENAGWSDPGEGTATVFSTYYSLGTDGVSFPANAIIHLTPIKADGTILSPSALDSYVDYLAGHASSIDGLINADKRSNGILLCVHSVTGSWQSAYSFADSVDECLHELQAIYYLDDTSELPSESGLRMIAQKIIPELLVVHNVLFHGRVISDGLDFYGQKTVSCEGALGCLLDSVIDPLPAITETPKDHLQKIIAAHNTLMRATPYPEPYKCFTVGNVTVNAANTNKKFEKVEGYSQTRSLIDDHLIDYYKGYLFARYESGTLYLDWLKNFNRENSQPIKMAVNMLDRTLEESADEYYTVMLPVGSKNTTIDGKYLQDAAAIKKYGRIFKAESFGDSKKKADLLAKAQKEFNKRGTNLPLSVHIKAVDMSLLGSDVDELLAGDHLTNVEDRTGALFTDLTIAEHNYDIFNPANDEFVMENQEAIDKRNTSSSGNGTISSRAGRGSKDLFDDTKNLYRHYDNLTLDVKDTYTLTADTIHENSKYHQIITGVFETLADESNVRTETDNIKTVKFKNFYINNSYGKGDYVRRGDKTYMFTGQYEPGTGWDQAVADGLVQETDLGESVDIKSIYGTHTHQDATGTTTVVQDVTGIQMNKTKPEITDFSADTEYKEGDYVRYNDKIFRCLWDHKGKFTGDHFAYVAEKKDESDIFTYTPVYKTDELGNTVMNLITGEAEYQLVDGNLDGVPISNPIKSITRRTQTEFYDVIGTTDTYQSVTDTFDPTKSYAVGKAVKYNGKFYRFIAAHPGTSQNPLPWDWDHVEPLTETTVVNGEQLYTLTSVNGSTLFHNEKEIDQIVGEIEIVQTKDADGKVVGRDLVIKNGGGIRSRQDNVEVGIFENGALNAGLMVNSLNSKSTDIVAIAFSSSKKYAVGDYVTYNGKVYRCITAHEGSWNASHFTEASGKIAKLKADIVDLGDYATVGTLNARLVKADAIFSAEATHDDAYVNDLYGDSITLSGTGLLTCESVITGGLVLGETDMEDAIVSIAEDANPPSGKIGFTYMTAGGTTGAVNFNIADTAKYKADIGIKSIGSWYWSNDDRKYLSQIKPNAGSDMYAELPTITLDSPLGTQSYANVFAYGPEDGGNKYAVSSAKALYLKTVASDNKCYLLNENADPKTGASGNILAEVAIPTADPGRITSLTLRSDLTTAQAITYDTTEKEYTVRCQATGSNVSNSPYQAQVAVSGSAAFNHGWNTLVANCSSTSYVSLGNSNSATGTPTKTTTAVTGYVWVKNASGNFEKRRSFSLSHSIGTVYHKSSSYSGSLSVKIYLGNGYVTKTSSALADSAWNNLK